MTPEKIRELIGKLRWLEKDTRDDLAAKRCNEAADALEHLLQFVEWKPIESAPMDNREQLNYVIIADKICMPDVAIWQSERAAYTDAFGTIHCARPAGWFNVSRSRIKDPTDWLPLPPAPPSHREEKE